MRFRIIFSVFFFIITLAPGVQAQGNVVSCNLGFVTGISNQQLESNGLERSYRLFVPVGYDGRNRLPLVLELHGSGGTADAQATTSRFSTLAASEGFLVASLQAPAVTGNRWNVPVTDDRPDDVAYVSDVIDHIASRGCLDPGRVYVTGFSGGARMSSQLACQLNSRITAIAPMAGLRWPAPCEGRPIPVLTIHGLADPQNTYEGGVEGRGGEWVESIPEALAGWASYNGCNQDLIFEDQPGPLSVMRYADCRAGAEVRLIRVDGLDHSWAKDAIDATSAMWQFFQEHEM